MHPKSLSIIMPFHNSAAELERFLFSYLGDEISSTQEFIIADHGYRDATLKVVSRFASQAFIRMIPKERDASDSSFLHLAAEKSENPYLLVTTPNVSNLHAQISSAWEKMNGWTGMAVSLDGMGAKGKEAIRVQSLSNVLKHDALIDESNSKSRLLLSGRRICFLCSKADLHILLGKSKPDGTASPGSKTTTAQKLNSKGGNAKEKNQRNALKKVQKIRYKLCNLGFTERAYQDLKEAVENTKNPHLRRLAAMELAVWHANRHTSLDAAKSLSFLKKAKNNETDQSQLQRMAVLESESLALLGSHAEARQVIDEAMKKWTHADLYLAAANLESNTAAKLHWINQAMSLHGLAEITCSMDESPSAYEGLQTVHGALRPSRQFSGSPKVSVIVPAYNAQDTICIALTSLLQQTWTNLEILVVDDCSTDGTLSAIQSSVLKDPRVRLIRAEANAGPYVARNLALQEAGGEFVTVHDADDWSHPQKLEVQVRHLVNNEHIVANMSTWVRTRPDLLFHRRGTPGLYVTKNLSSLMFRREPVLQNAGFWDSVRFAADSEYVRRLKKIFGSPAVCGIETGPVVFARQDGSSLTNNDWFGYPGYVMGARKAYFMAYNHWHNTTHKFYIEFPQKKRPFPVPAPMKPERDANENSHTNHFDVIICTECRLTGGTVASTLEEIKAQNWMGLKTGVVHISRYDLNTAKPWNAKLLDVIDEHNAHILVYGQEVTCDLLIIRHPPVLEEYQKYLPKIHFQHMVVIVNQAPFRDYDDPASRVYRLQKCANNLRCYFDTAGVWHPIGPAVREALMQDPEAQTEIHVDDRDWVNIIDIESWQRAQAGKKKAKPVIGRHSRDHYVKWPASSDELLAAYPATDDFEVKILGGAESPQKLLGYLPQNWTVYPYDSLSAAEFLAQIDVFVYFTHPGLVEAFGRTPLEAMAAGVPVILPESFRPLFQEAAIYATPFDVQPIVMELYYHPTFYQQQVKTAQEFVYHNFGYGQHKKRLADYVQALYADTHIA